MDFAKREAGATPSPKPVVKRRKPDDGKTGDKVETSQTVETQVTETLLLESDDVLFTALKDQLGSPSPDAAEKTQAVLDDGYDGDMLVSPAKPKHLFATPAKTPSQTPAKTPSKTSVKTLMEALAEAETQVSPIQVGDTIAMEFSPQCPTTIDPYDEDVLVARMNQCTHPPNHHPSIHPSIHQSTHPSIHAHTCYTDTYTCMSVRFCIQYILILIESLQTDIHTYRHTHIHTYMYVYTHTHMCSLVWQWFGFRIE